MILILIAILISAVTSWVLMLRGTEFLSFVASIFAVMVIVASIGYTFAVGAWIGSEHKAKIINEQFGTNYSREEVFWSNDLIQSFHNLKKEQVDK